MNKPILLVAAILGGASSILATPADAGMRMGGGFRFRSFIFQPNYYSPPTYSSVDEDRPVRRKSAHSKPEKPAPKVPLVKFADGTGRQYDPASKVWFDGKSQCYSGKEAFTYKGDTWRYGSARWSLDNAAWKSSGDSQPELVSCESVPAFAAKANTIASKTAAPAQSIPPAVIKTAEGDLGSATKAKAPAPSECKKYFPSVGQMLTVPCSE
jgi:hypothetical protein